MTVRLYDAIKSSYGNKKAKNKILSPEEQFYNKQKNLLNFYNTVDALNVKKVGPGRPPSDLIRLDPISEPKPKGRPKGSKNKKNYYL